METDQAWAASRRRTRHIGDFRAWKDHNPYQKSFERLLRDLKASRRARTPAPSLAQGKLCGYSRGGAATNGVAWPSWP